MRPPFDMKFIDPSATKITPLTVLGVNPTETEFCGMQLGEEIEVTNFYFITRKFPIPFFSQVYPKGQK